MSGSCRNPKNEPISQCNKMKYGNRNKKLHEALRQALIPSEALRRIEQLQAELDKANEYIQKRQSTSEYDEGYANGQKKHQDENKRIRKVIDDAFNFEIGKKLDETLAELDSLKAEKGMADMGFVSEGARKEIDQLQAELKEVKADAQIERNYLETLKIDYEQLQAELDKHRWIPVIEPPPSVPRPVKYIVRVEWKGHENPVTWEEDKWVSYVGGWQRWDTGNTRVTHYMSIILPKKDSG